MLRFLHTADWQLGKPYARISDPERQAGVYRMLQQAADQGLQVLLLTCDPERSQGIEGVGRVLLGG